MLTTMYQNSDSACGTQVNLSQAEGATLDVPASGQSMHMLHHAFALWHPGPQMANQHAASHLDPEGMAVRPR